MKASSAVKAALSIFAAAYPFVVFFAIRRGFSLLALSLILLLVLIVNFALYRRVLVLAMGLALLVLVALSGSFECFKLYPVFMNLAFASLFGFSLLGKPLVQSIAERLKGALPPQGVAYARKATIAWFVFLSCLSAISFATLFAPLEVWTIFNGMLSYILIALMFAAEYLVRRKVLNAGKA